MGAGVLTSAEVGPSVVTGSTSFRTSENRQKSAREFLRFKCEICMNQNHTAQSPPSRTEILAWGVGNKPNTNRGLAILGHVPTERPGKESCALVRLPDHVVRRRRGGHVNICSPVVTLRCSHAA